MTFAEYAEAWSRLHGGYDLASASSLVRGWVRAAYRIGSALARARIGPNAVTTAGLVLCLAVPVAVLAGSPGGLFAGGLLVIAAAVADTLDGAVAVVTGTTTRFGYVYDSVADRVGEAAWLVAFWLAGVPGWLAVGCGAAGWLHEYVRARAAAAGMPGLGAVTLGERPTRVSMAASGLVLGGAVEVAGVPWGSAVPVVFAVAWLALAVVGLAQLAVAVRRALP